MVHTLLSRDTDSRIIPREKEAVNEWLASDRVFHIMRDHPAHCLFGYTKILNSSKWPSLVDLQDRFPVRGSN